MNRVGSARSRCLAVGLLHTGLCIGAALTLLPVVSRVPSSDSSFAEALTWLSAAVALPGLAALLLIGWRGVHDSWSGVARPERLGVRRLVMVACGAGLITAALVPGAHAEQGPAPAPRSALAESLSGLPLPDRALSRPLIPASAPANPVPGPASMDTSERDTVLVQPGDSLWRISASELSPHASAAQIAAHVRRLHELNRAHIGPDPDLIHPGLQLRLPRTQSRLRAP